ncbi:aldo/keto reductase [Actinacidiphila glaucinigra]|uniref:aldo/keto reductase n=1 Tax=Actinacidiphila glaucinigra TaxID=235986 RepID=UPI00367052DB
MQTTTLGDLTITRIGLGCMGMSALYTGHDQDNQASIATIRHALDAGVTFFDTAEIYGPYRNEELLAQALAGRRDKAVIATKFGAIRHATDGSVGLDSSPATIRLAVEGSLKRLNTDHIDLYYQHRVDPNTPIEDVAGTLAELVHEGKILHYGLSEASSTTIRRANAVHPVAAVQSEYSLWTRDVEDDVLPTIRDIGALFVPYSPLGRGFLTGAITTNASLDSDDFRRTNPRFAEHNLPANWKLVEEVRAIATELQASPAQVALAWLLSRSDNIAPIPGTRRVDRLKENLAADTLALGCDHLARLDALQPAQGDRLADMTQIDR